MDSLFAFRQEVRSQQGGPGERRLNIKYSLAQRPPGLWCEMVRRGGHSQELNQPLGEKPDYRELGNPTWGSPHFIGRARPPGP